MDMDISHIRVVKGRIKKGKTTENKTHIGKESAVHDVELLMVAAIVAQTHAVVRGKVVGSVALLLGRAATVLRGLTFAGRILATWWGLLAVPKGRRGIASLEAVEMPVPLFFKAMYYVRFYIIS